MIEKHCDLSNDQPDPLKENPHLEAIPDQFLPGQHNVGSKSSITLVHELVVNFKATIKTDNKKPHKLSK